MMAASNHCHEQGDGGATLYVRVAATRSNAAVCSEALLRRTQ